MSYDLYNDDCRRIFEKIPDHSIDVILTDPPYNIAQYSTGNIPLPGRSAVNNDLGEWDLSEIKPSEYVEEFKRIIKPDGNIFILQATILLESGMKHLTQSLILFSISYGTKQILCRRYLGMVF